MPIHALHDMHLYLHQPTVVMKARVNLPAGATYPIATIPFDTVSVGAYTDVAPDSFFVIGSADGLDDRGRGRVQNVLSATNLPVGRLSRGTHDGEIDVYDNDYITFYNDFRVWAKIPFSNTDTGIDYKDSDVAVGDYLTTDMPPVANCGPGFAAYINSITSLITVAFDGTGSYAMADGATISTYAWDLQGGTVTVGTLTSSTLTATFPAGFRWVVLTVTDSNGTSHTTRCPVLAVNPAADVTIPFAIESWEKVKEGQTFNFRLLDNRLRTTYPDGCLVLFWWDAPLSPADRSHMQFIGWHQSDSFSIRATPQGLVRDTVLNCVDVAGRLAALPGFPQALQREDEDDVDEMWSLMPTLDMRKCLHYLIFWHSTAAGLADLFLSADLADYPSMRLDSTGASLYEQINSRAQSIVPDHWFVCNAKGQLSVLADWMLLDFDDRPTIVASLSEDYWASMEVTYQRPPKVYVLNSSAVISSTDWLMLGGEKTLPLAFCKAPGTAFGQGVSEATTGEKLTISQAALNACEGHRYARLNARYGLFSITEPSGTIAGDADALEPAAMLPIEVAISAATAAQRGLDFTVTRGMVKRISMRANTTAQGTWFAPTIQFEKEVVGLPAVTHVPEVPDTPDFETPEPPPGTVPPDDGLIGGQELVAGIGIDGYVYRTSDFQTVSGSGGPTWTRVDTTIADTIYSFVVDPFSPGYAAGATSGAINGWIVNDTDIYRVTDLFGTVVAVSVFTFDEPTVAASFHWRSIQASFGAFFGAGANPWLLCVSYYGDTAGHQGTWATRSTDGGVTWSAEVQISASFDAEVATRFNPIGVYASPKTPGLAYTAAHINVAGGPLPNWGIWQEDEATLLVLGTSATALATSSAASTGSGNVQSDRTLILAPPPNAARVLCEVAWSANITETEPGTPLTVTGLAVDNPGTLGRTDDLVYIAPDVGSGGGSDSESGNFAVEWTFGGGDWPVNTTTIISSPPTGPGFGARFEPHARADADPGESCSATVTVTVTVIEIELDGGFTYTPTDTEADGFVSTDWGASWAAATLPDIQPGQAQAGTLHFPWPTNGDEQLVYYGHFDNATNREFRLKRAQGATITDISPSTGGRSYGVNRGPFGIRAFDSNRQYLLLAGIGNDTTALGTGDFHGVFASDDFGATWAVVVSPIADSGAPAGRPAFEAAFGGDSEEIMFIWGPGAYISYSSNFGVAVDSRSGNLAALGLTTGLLGIAGGPNG